MTITVDTNRWAYLGNGATTGFDYTNKIFASADLKVYVDSILQTETTHYSVTNVGEPDGGKVNFVTAPPAPAVAGTKNVVIVRDVPATQLRDLRAFGNYDPVGHETADDKLTVLMQQIADLIDRALVLAESDPDGIGTLPDKATRAGKTLAFDGAGDPIAGATDISALALTYVTELFDGDANETDFTLSTAPASVDVTEVFIDGARQVPLTDYTLSDTTLTFLVPPPVGTGIIHVRYGAAFASVPSDGSVTLAKMAADAVDWVVHAVHKVAGNIPFFGASGVPALLAPPATAQVLGESGGLPAWTDHALVQAFISGCVPSSAADAAHDISFTAGKCLNAAGTKVLTLPAFTKQFDAAFAEGDAAGGFGAALPTSGTYYIFAITKDADASVDYFGDTSSTGTNVPSGWTVEREVYRHITDGSDDLLPFDGYALAGGALEIELRTGTLDINNAPVASTRTIGTLSVPAGKEYACFCAWGMGPIGIGASNPGWVHHPDKPDYTESTGSAGAGIIGSSDTTSQHIPSGNVHVRTNASQQVAYRTTKAITLSIVLHRWIDDRIA